MKNPVRLLWRRSRGRSPLNAQVLRLPGESVRRLLIDEVFRGLSWIALGGVAAGFVLGMSFGSNLAADGLQISGTLTFSLLLIVVMVSAIGLARATMRVEDFQLGRDGEIAVAQYLQQFERIGYRVIHDLPGDRWNVDHLLIGPTGIWVLETKTWRKPERGKCQIVYDGKILRRPNGKWTAEPIDQIKRNIEWVGRLMRTKTGKSWPVRGAVLLPGWLIESAGAGRSQRVWVLNPKALSAFLENAPKVLSKDEVREANNTFRTYIRAFQSVRDSE